MLGSNESRPVSWHALQRISLHLHLICDRSSLSLESKSLLSSSALLEEPDCRHTIVKSAPRSPRAWICRLSSLESKVSKISTCSGPYFSHYASLIPCSRCLCSRSCAASTERARAAMTVTLCTLASGFIESCKKFDRARWTVLDPA